VNEARQLSSGSDITTVKSVSFSYIRTPLIQELLETFRDMVNAAIHICLEEDIRGRLRLRDRIYKEFQEKYVVISCYPYSVAEVAWSIVKKHRRWNRKPFEEIDDENGFTELLTESLDSLFAVQEGRANPDSSSVWLLSTLLHNGHRDKTGFSEVTNSAIIIAFSKLVSVIQPQSVVGLDLNEKSAVVSDGTSYNLSDVARLHTEYGVRRRVFYQMHAHDNRLKKKFAGSRREKERVKQLLHRVSKNIVETAKAKHQAIVLEALRGIRLAHERCNSEGKGARRRIAQWPFHIMQAYILYKAKWSGVQVEFVSAVWTSRTCNKCHHVNRQLKLTEREWRCPNCGAILDRDLNAAINIERRGKIPCLGEVRPGAQDTDEAVKGNETTTAPILRAEALKLARLEHVQSS
jgi:putative transposase